jgi:RNase P subunit RPR2
MGNVTSPYYFSVYKGILMRLRILGETKLKRDATCPYCKEIAKPKGTIVEVLQDMNTGKQYVSFPCNECKEMIMTG